jgi:hypothetical protein
VLFNNSQNKKPDIDIKIIDDDSDYLKEKRRLKAEYTSKSVDRCIAI